MVAVSQLRDGSMHNLTFQKTKGPDMNTQERQRVLSKKEHTKAIQRYARRHGWHARTVRNNTDLRHKAIAEWKAKVGSDAAEEIALKTALKQLRNAAENLRGDGSSQRSSKHKMAARLVLQLANGLEFGSFYSVKEIAEQFDFQSQCDQKSNKS
jgi:hypothetical protein